MPYSPGLTRAHPGSPGQPPRQEPHFQPCVRITDHLPAAARVPPERTGSPTPTSRSSRRRGTSRSWKAASSWLYLLVDVPVDVPVERDVRESGGGHRPHFQPSVRITDHLPTRWGTAGTSAWVRLLPLGRGAAGQELLDRRKQLGHGLTSRVVGQTSAPDVQHLREKSAVRSAARPRSPVVRAIALRTHTQTVRYVSSSCIGSCVPPAQTPERLMLTNFGPFR